MAKTTKPKGSTSFKETAFGILPRSKIIPLEAEGIKKALQYIIKLSEKKIKITPELIQDIHKVGFGFIFPDWTGKFRTVDVTVGDYEPPHYSKIAVLVKNLCDDLEERLKHIPSIKDEEQFLAEVISLLAWFQHQFVWIHPFKDYNGRIARLLTNLLVLNYGLPALEIKAETGQDRQRYIKAMKAADDHDPSKLESLLAKALKESLEKV
ncbi:Fic family protein [Candidatus Daviesbacteria bacterium]|nr:Fic family protein [Candidatus Daviesbacteria bacterium]